MHSEDHDLLVSIDTRVGKLERELLGNGQPGVIKDHETRISKLENWRSWIAGGMALLGASATLYALVK